MEKWKMRRWIIYLIMVLLMFPLVMALTELTECTGVMNPGDIPCMIISTWNITSCITETIQIYQSNSTLIDTKTMGDFGLSGRCNATWNHSAIDSYVLDWSSGDSSKIIIGEDEDMILGIVLGVGIISALLLFFAFKLDDEHIILKILFMISSITLLILIPVSTFITTTSNAGRTFYRVFLYIFIAFWLYVFLYFCYWILKKLGWIVSGEEQ